MRYIVYTILFVICLITASQSYAGENINLPRYASLSSNEVNMRAGPGKQYPIKWVYQRKGYPIEIIREYDIWYKIRDIEGYSGWIYKGLISSKRMALVTIPPSTERQTTYLYRKTSTQSDQIALLENGAQVAIDSCNGPWCEISSQGIKGWIPRKLLWGIYEHEVID